ncbi:N-6 DNA methylase [Streptomyces sp. H27-S2]|uniref:N-6 DNA methylase n=1 Tax=Streptomyces antarcticus TaxID=2996458 RepID=UPI002271150B|nr:N-6 DNA methylase [Streptomyces sp. H27-S2]MCY0951863.1 N-6 DNA methylase [Streptomyces sp. H27-S2]
MPEESAAGAEVTAAEVARLAGVGRAAVSNWRRRHADFPKPAGGSETSPSFALAEVEDWLRVQGKLAEVPLRERVWQQVCAHPGGAVPALTEVGAALLVVRDRPTDWLELTAVSDERTAALLRPVFGQVLAARLGAGHPLAAAPPRPASVPLLRAAAGLAAELGARKAFEFLLARHLDANPRQYTRTPGGLAELMAALAGPGVRTVLDPACGTGTLLRAVPGATALYAQDSSPELAVLAALRLALHGSAQVRAAAADSLRADAHPRPPVDAVLCHPPFNERDWGHEELAYDPRWEYGFPARTESELAWVQHALAHLREGGTAVLLMPPAVAARRSGRRIRADLLRRGALRAVVALPAGAAPPYGIPLHLWVLRRPAPHAAPPAGLLLVDTAGATTAATTGAEGRPRPAWPAVHGTVEGAWAAYERTGAVEEVPGVSRVVPVIELLDDDVDLTPARHLPPAAGGGPAELSAVRGRLDEILARAARLAPPPADPPAGDAGRPPLTTVGELARAGALWLHTGTGGGTGTAPVLTVRDVLAGRGPSGALAATADEPVLTAPGDVLVPVAGGASTAGGACGVRVVGADCAGAVPGRGLHLLRPDPGVLDPWFLAGFLRGTANNRRASSHASTATRLDVRRLRLPRLPLAQQRRYGDRFRALAEFEDALRQAGRLGEQLVQGLYDGLADGTVTP